MTSLPTPHRHLCKYITAWDSSAHLLPSYLYAFPSRISYTGCLYIYIYIKQDVMIWRAFSAPAVNTVTQNRHSDGLPGSKLDTANARVSRPLRQDPVCRGCWNWANHSPPWVLSFTSVPLWTGVLPSLWRMNQNFTLHTSDCRGEGVNHGADLNCRAQKFEYGISIVKLSILLNIKKVKYSNKLSSTKPTIVPTTLMGYVEASLSISREVLWGNTSTVSVLKRQVGYFVINHLNVL